MCAPPRLLEPCGDSSNPSVHRDNRGWSPGVWDAAVADLVDRELLDQLIRDLSVLAKEIVDAGAIPFPNPMGLPRPEF